MPYSCRNVQNTILDDFILLYDVPQDRTRNQVLPLEELSNFVTEGVFQSLSVDGT